MTRCSYSSRALCGVLVFVGALFLCGFKPAGIDDIQTAVIKKDFKKAKQLAAEYIAGNPAAGQKGEALYYLGLSELYLGDHRQARDTFQQALTLRPEGALDSKINFGIIDSYLLAGDYQTALDLSMDMVKGTKNSEYTSLLYLKIARANLRLRQWQEAQDYLNRIIHTFPQSPEFHRAKQLLEEKQYFAVQVGSFLEQEKALTLVEELQDKKEYAYIVETTDKDGRKFYRVRVGQFSDLDQAQDMKRKLTRLGYPTRIYP